MSHFDLSKAALDLKKKKENFVTPVEPDTLMHQVSNCCVTSIKPEEWE
jgi:hypothetical protein